MNKNTLIVICMLCVTCFFGTAIYLSLKQDISQLRENIDQLHENTKYMHKEITTTNFRNREFKKVSFEGTGFLNVFFDNAKLVKADFSGADFCGAVSFKNADLRGARFYEVNKRELCSSNDPFDFTGADLGGANLHDADLQNSIFKNTGLRNTNFSFANLSNADFTGSFLYTTTDLFYANLCHAKITDTSENREVIKKSDAKNIDSIIWVKEVKE